MLEELKKTAPLHRCGRVTVQTGANTKRKKKTKKNSISIIVLLLTKTYLDNLLVIRTVGPLN